MSEKRRSVLPDIEVKITEFLNSLECQMQNSGYHLLRLKDFTPSGIDQADFLFSANKQIAPENLAKIASGGELSRVMLSLNHCLQEIIIFLL